MNVPQYKWDTGHDHHLDRHVLPTPKWQNGPKWAKNRGKPKFLVFSNWSVCDTCGQGGEEEVGYIQDRDRQKDKINTMDTV